MIRPVGGWKPVLWTVIFCTAVCTGCTRRDSGVGRPDLNEGAGGLLALAAEEYAAELQFSPVAATWLGDHRLDDRLDDVRLETINREIARLKTMQERVSRIATDLDGGLGPERRPERGPEREPEREIDRPESGSERAGRPERGPERGPERRPERRPERKIDRSDRDRSLDKALLQSRIEDRLLELSDQRPYERNPIFYMDLIAYGIDGLLTQDFVQVEARIRVLSRRLKAIPDLCREAQRNLRNPPEVFTRRAIELGQLTRDFLVTLLPRLVRGVTDPKLFEEFNRNNEEARKALDEFISWLSHDLQPRSKGEWSLSRERFLSRLRAAELLDVGVDVVQGAAERELREARRRMEEVARRLTGAPGGSGGTGGVGLKAVVADAMRLLEDDHAGPGELQREAEGTLSDLYQFMAQREVLTLPAARAKVAEMPPYRWGYALLAAPGPLESRTRDAVFYIDPVDPGWTDKKKVQEHLRMLNRAQLRLTAIHEVVPGHYLQMEAVRRAWPGLSMVRQRYRSQAFLEGWAQYAEQLMAELEPDSDRLVFLSQRSLMLRLSRLLLTLRLHAPPVGGAPVSGAAVQARLEEATRALMDDCYLDEYAARKEVERAMLDPLCGLPALGWLQLAKLRADVRKEQGDHFTLQAYHDLLLRQGELPVVALRRLLLRDPAGPSL